MKSMLIALSLAATLAAHPVPAVAHSAQPFATMPRAAWADEDPADSLYRAARRALTQKDFEAAAKMFDTIVSKYPRSEYAPDALYWKGFALYRNGNLRDAFLALETQARRYPQAPTREDASALLIEIKGQLAQRGDAAAQRDVNSAAAQSGRSCDDMEVQVAALDAVQQIDAERALPLLRRVLARRDACSTKLRKNALFILAQKSGIEREKILLDVAKTDPDPGVKQDAVFHLQQGKTEAAVAALEDLLLHSDERGVQKNALFALAQNGSERARKTIKSFALSNDASIPLRKDAIFHIAQSRNADDAAWLREVYTKIPEVEIRNDILFNIANRAGPETNRFLMGVVLDEKENATQRKNALFHLAQRRIDNDELISVYDKATPAMRKEIIFYLAQRRDAASLDKLIAIAKGDPSIQLRKEALFYLGQSKDPRALKAIEEIANP